MKRSIALLLLGIGAYLTALVATLPASQAYALALHYMGEEALPVRLSGLEGTAWHGQASQVAFDKLVVGTTSWTLAPLGLVTGSLPIDWNVTLPDGALAGRVRIDPTGSMELTDINGQVAAEWVATKIGSLPVTADGRLAVRLDRLTLGEKLSGNGTLVWSGASLSMGEPLRLGDLKLELEPAEGGGLAGTLSDSGGPLAIGGRVSLSADGRYRIDARIGAREKGTPLAQAVALLGRPGPDGRAPLQMSGRL